jgi:autotransporter-associated beta strand protein
MFLLDDSSVKGDITPSALESVSNRLHIDTTAGQVITGALKNFAAVDINRGSSIDTKWKETPAIQKYLGVNPETSLVIEPGTGAVTFAGINSYSGPTTVAAGKLIIAPSGELSGSASMEIMPMATLQNDGKIINVGSYTQQPNATLSITPNAPSLMHPISIVGTARLGGTVVFGKGSKNWKPGVTYTLLKAGNIQGTFSVVTSESKLKPTIKYGKNTLTVSFKN